MDLLWSIETNTRIRKQENVKSKMDLQRDAENLALLWTVGNDLRKGIQRKHFRTTGIWKISQLT